MSGNSLADLIEKNPCAKCRAARKLSCKCGPQGGSGSGGGSSESTENKAAESTGSRVSGAVAFQSSENNIALNPEIRYDLLNTILTVEDNHDLGMLTLECNPRLTNLLTKEEKSELNSIFAMIKMEFDKFKNEYDNSGKFCNAQMEKDPDGNITSLIISIRNPKLFDLFMESIKEKLGLIAQKPEHEVTSENPSKDKTKTLPSPFSAMNALKPKGWED